MTHPIVEKVAKVIEMCSGIPRNPIKDGHNIEAKAAVLATIDALMEPSDKVKHEAWYISTDTISQEKLLTVHKYLLTQARKEIEDV